MASVSTITVFLLCHFFIASTDSQDGCDEYAETGTSFTVPLKHTLKESENLRWFHNTTIIFNSKLDKGGKGKDFFVESTGSLKLTKLTQDKSGLYTPVVYDEDGRYVEDLPSLSLCILDFQDGCDEYAAAGTSFTVPLKHKLQESSSLRWLHVTKIIFKRRKKQVITGKNEDVDSTGSLKLTQLTKDKSGQYTPQVYDEDGVSVGDLQSLRLCVLDRVQKPDVMVKCTDSKTNVNFTCNVGQNEKNFMIEWFMDDEKLEEKEKTLTRVAKDVANAHFSCNVSNPVSSEISLPVQQNCYELYSQDVCNLYGAIGDSIVVPLNHKLDKASALKWKHNDTIIFEQRKNKSPNPIYVKGKKDDINPDGSLKLKNLDANGSGNYIPKVYNQDGALESNMKITRLCVLARVQKPRVKIMCPNKSEVKFTCVVSQNENDFKIEWLMEGKRLKEKEMTLTRVAKDVVNASFSCNVSNPVSSELSLPVQQNCYAPYSQDGCDEYAATGSSVTVPLKHKLQESENLRWFHNTTIIFNSKLDKRNKRKDFFVDSTGSLKLTKLMKDNSGQYTPIVYDEEGRNVAHLLSLSLCVLDPVQKPNVMVKCTDYKINVSFTCSVDQKENYLEYKWLTQDKELTGNLKDTLTRKAEDVVNLPIACNVSNPVSFAISEPVYPECLKLYVAGEKSGPNIWVFVRFGAGFFLLLLLIVIVCSTSLMQKNKYAIRDTEEFPLSHSGTETTAAAAVDQLHK